MTSMNEIGVARTGTGAHGRRVNLVRLAKSQRWLILAILARLVLEAMMWAFVWGGGGGPAQQFGALGIIALWMAANIATIALVANMARAYGFNWFMSVAGALVTVLGCIGLVVLVLLNQRVITTLQKAGVKVGFFGVNAREMNKLRLGVCGGCGYDIRGLTGGTCPECGAVLAPPIAAG